ncbi:hypothetical protein F2P56_033403 [Juglans regia]|uniref:Retrotransposon Copia-like N-terminal domain-containing protein n=1 Tax=Juglans regia TaxID=51240 RepID=A0A833SUV1_JUGRE|nr:hypothetical protein F2P56_033403 [Juglans regia]
MAASSTQTPSQLISDLTSPYFLTAADNPGATLVPELLTGDNYPSWRRSMRMALNAKNKFVFVDGTLTKPADVSIATLWERCCDMVLSWLLNSIDKSLRQSLIYCQNPFEVWKDLDHQFSQSNHPRLYRLKHDLVNLCQDSMTVTAYYNTIKGLWDELHNLQEPTSCTCSARENASAKENIEHLFQFFMGLNDSFNNIRSQILAMDPLPSIAKAYATVHQEEAQRHLHLPLLPTPDNTPMAVSRPFNQVHNRAEMARNAPNAAKKVTWLRATMRLLDTQPIGTLPSLNRSLLLPLPTQYLGHLLLPLQV